MSGLPQVGIAAGFARMTLLIALPVVVAVIALLTGVDIGGGRWLSAVILLLAISALATTAWFVYRWRRHSQRPAPAAP
jgi:hypothetical protein